MEVDTGTWWWKIQGPRIKSFLQSTLLPDVGIISGPWLSNINKEKIVVRVHKSKKNDAEFALVVEE